MHNQCATTTSMRIACYQFQCTIQGTIILVECRVDVAAAKMGRDKLSAKSHDTKNPRKLDFVSLSVAKAGSQSGGL